MCESRTLNKKEWEMKCAVALLIASVTSATLGMSAQADDIRLGTPGYGGNGCPGGSASVTLSPDKKSLSILFDEYIVEAGGSSGKKIDRKSCNIAVPVHIPQGYSISVFQVDYRGYTFVPSGGEARFSAEYFFAGIRGPSVEQSFRGFVDNQYVITNRLAAESLVWSACGQDVNMRINTGMMARTNSRGDQLLATVDSTDIKSGIIYHVQWRRCS